MLSKMMFNPILSKICLNSGKWLEDFFEDSNLLKDNHQHKGVFVLPDMMKMMEHGRQCGDKLKCIS